MLATATRHERAVQLGGRYEPLVFTTQGGCETTAEAFLSRIADAIGREESRDASRVKAAMLEAISMSIVKSVASAVARRRPRRRAIEAVDSQQQSLADMAILEDPMED